MATRYIALWFRHLLTDWHIRRHPEHRQLPLVFAASSHNRMLITATSIHAESMGLYVGMPLADAKALIADLEIVDHLPDTAASLLQTIGEWCIRYSPTVSVDLPDGLIIDASGCAHLWGGEREYLKEIVTKFRANGYDVRGAMADTIGTAWAISRYGKVTPIIANGEQSSAILSLPPLALRLEEVIIQRLQKLGFNEIGSFINMPRSVLRRRFGPQLLLRIGQAVGYEREDLVPIRVITPYEERLPCLEPIRTATGIEIALQQLLAALCLRLQNEGKGLREATLICYRVDDEIEQTAIGTNRASHSASHLFKLFELQIAGIAPGLGIELFILEAGKIEELSPAQEKLWAKAGLEDNSVTELLDRIANKIGIEQIQRFLPAEHHWPERSLRPANSLNETPSTTWKVNRPRPVKLLAEPLPIEVTAPIPDYPPMLFRYQHKLHEIKRADGPERIEREWWLDGGEHRDYYVVEDAEGCRYWVFRLGHYSGKQSDWYIHGFFA
jgi:protein ImuB